MLQSHYFGGVSYELDENGKTIRLFDADRKNKRPFGAAPAGAPPSPPAGGHASPHLFPRPQRGAGAPAGVPRNKAESGLDRPRRMGQGSASGGGTEAKAGKDDCGTPGGQTRNSACHYRSVGKSLHCSVGVCLQTRGPQYLSLSLASPPIPAFPRQGGRSTAPLLHIAIPIAVETTHGTIFALSLDRSSHVSVHAQLRRE